MTLHDVELFKTLMCFVSPRAKLDSMVLVFCVNLVGSINIGFPSFNMYLFSCLSVVDSTFLSHLRSRSSS